MKEPSREQRIQGAEQVLAVKRALMAQYFVAKRMGAIHPTSTWHGVRAEQLFRDWLNCHLPKRYKAVSARIISQQFEEEDFKARHYDCVIYDQLRAPILWKEDEETVALPAEYVLAVGEVKATWTSNHAKAALKKLEELRPLLQVDSPEEPFPKYLPQRFFSFVVFFEANEKVRYSQAAMENLVPETALRGYCGGWVLGYSEELIAGDTGRIDFTGQIQLCHHANTPSGSLLKQNDNLKLAFSNPRKWGENELFSSMIHWNKANFAMSLWTLVKLLEGKYKGGVPSFHGMGGFESNW